MTIDPQTQARKLAIIRSLLAQAEDPAATEAEAESYNRKAAQLIAQYGIDAAMLAEETPGSDVVGDRMIRIDNPYGMDKLTLLNVIAEAMRCRLIAVQGGTRGGKTWSGHLFGHASDMDRVELLFTSLLLQAATGVAHTLPANAFASAPQVAAHRRSWLAGFTYAVQGRLQAAEKRAAADVPTGGGRSMDLVLADRTALVKRAVTDAYPHARAGRKRSLSGGGYGAGHAAGSRADLGTGSGTLSRNSGQKAVGA